MRWLRLLFLCPLFLFSETIQTDTLKKWIDQGKQMTIIDARSEQQFDHMIIPGAKWVPWESADAAIQSAVPNKNRLVVIYCCNPSCGASEVLQDKMAALGYTNLNVYSDGLDAWKSKGYPTAKI